MNDVVRISAVKVTERGLRVDRDLEIHDLDVRTAATSALAAGQPLDEWLTHIVRAGVAACVAVGSRTDLDQLERALSGLDQKVNKAVDDAVSRLSEHVSSAVDPRRNGLAAVSQESMQRLNDGVGRLVAGEDAVLARNLRSLVTQVFQDAQTAINEIVSTQATTTQRVLQQDREQVRQSILAVVERQHGELRTSLAEIRESLAVATSVKRARANTSQRGEDYEVACLDLVHAVAARTGDLGGVVHTGRVAGADGGCAGDITVTLSALGTGGDKSATLVIEAKDRRRSSKLSLAAFTAEARRGRANRLAEVSLVLCPPEAMPVRDQLVVLLEPCSMLVCWQPGDDDDLVTAAWLMLKLLALSKNADPHGEVDVDRAQAQLASAQAALEKIDEITKHAGQAERSLAHLKTHTVALKTELLRRLLQIGRTLNGEQGDAEGADTEAAPADAA
jgi:hypothetical protein